jgi:hypothetical protein
MIAVATITKQPGKRRTTYKVRIRKPGNPTVTKTFSSKSLAEKWARITELEIEEGTYFEKREAEKHKVSDLIKRYEEEELEKLTPNDRESRYLQLKWWNEEIGNLRLNKVNAARLVECRRKLKTEPNAKGKMRSGSTVNRYIAALSAAFGVAATEWQWVQDNPFKGLRREKESDGHRFTFGLRRLC